MAITTYTTPNNTSILSTSYPHDRKYKALFSCLSSEYANYIDFHYIFKLYTEDGLITTFTTNPATDGYGIFDAHPYIFKLLSKDYKDAVGIFKMMQEYRVSVQEFYSGTAQGSETYFDKCQMSLRNDNYNTAVQPFEYKTLMGRIISDGLSKDLRQTINSTGYFNIQVGAGVTYVEYYIKFANGIKWQVRFNLTGSYSFSALSTTVDDADDSGNYVPAGYLELISESFDTVGYYDASGTWVASVATITGVDSLESSDITEIWIWSPIDNSSKVHYTIDCYKNNITVIWLNQHGGYEFYTFGQNKVEHLAVDKQRYNTNNYTDFFQDNSKHNTKEINIKGKLTYEVSSKFLTKDEQNYLTSLFMSDSIYINVDGTLMPVIIKEESYERYTKKIQPIKIKLEYAVN